MGQIRIKNILGVFLSGSMLAAHVVPVWAQDAPDARSSANREVRILEEVVVSAQKHSENMQTVPITVQAFSADQLAAAQITNMESLAILASGFTVSQTRAVPEISIRGVGTKSNTVSTEQAVALYVDGVYRPTATAANFSLFNVESIEVDKGPQGTLFGRNALGGVVQITTKDPQQTPYLNANISYGNFETLTGSAYGTMGITDNLAANITVYANDQSDGWGTNLFDFSPAHQGHEIFASTKWVYSGDKTRVTVSADWDEYETPHSEPSLVAGLYSHFPFDYGQPQAGGFWDTYQPVSDRNLITQFGLGVKLDHDLGWARLVSISAGRYADRDFRGFFPTIPPYEEFGQAVPPPAGYRFVGHNQYQRTFTQEINLLSPEESRLQWSAGLFFLNDWAASLPHSGGRLRIAQQTHSYAGFGEVTMPVMTDDTHFTVGYRFTHDRRSVSGFSYDAQGQITGTEATNPQPKKSWEDSSYRVALSHKFSEKLFGYVSHSTAYQSGYYNLSAGPGAGPSDPEKIRSSEIGLKMDLLDDSLRLNLSAYYYEIANRVASIVIVNPLTGTRSTVVQNAAESEGEGIDIQLEYLPSFVHGLSLTAGLSLADPTYSDFADAEYLAPSGNGLTWVGIPGDATGNYVQNTEETSASAGVQYLINTSRGNVRFAINSAYHSGIYFDPQNIAKQPSYTLTNASVVWNVPDGNYEVTLWCRNCSNKEYLSRIAPSTIQWLGQVAMPRTYGVTFGIHF